MSAAAGSPEVWNERRPRLLPRLACLTTPRSYMAAASTFHLLNLSTNTKAADGLYETKVL